MRQMTEAEIDAKLAEINKNFESVKARVGELERETIAGREELLRIQGDYRTWLSFKETQDTPLVAPSATEASV